MRIRPSFLFFYMKCFNLIYRLLVLSFIALMLIAIWQGWDKYYLFPLFIITSILLFERYERIIYDKIGTCCVCLGQKVKAYFHALVIKLSTYLAKKVQKWGISDKVHSLLLLSPEIDVEAHKEYIIRLKAAIDNPDVHNVALSGAYGSGKSSILKTFKWYYSKYKAIDVSLASFGDENGGDDKDENRLEYRILQQLFYQVKMSDISESRFGRIERTSFAAKIVWTLSLCLVLASYVCLFKKDFLQGMLPLAEHNSENKYLEIIALVILVLGLAFFVFKIVHLLKRLGLKNFEVKVSSASLEIEDKKNVTAMNRYLDEILYLFQRKKYEVVFFEDLDRFGDVRIFTKLRELNQLLNQSEEINRRVVFVYALCDDVFSCPEDRTKFFDYIIPVIPYVNVSNSGDLFKRSFKALQLPEDRLSTEFLTDISHFVNDTRVLKNIVNEFTLYQHVLDPKLDLQHLLAIILYKNLYPKDFCLLHQGKGLVYGAFASVPFLKKEKKNAIEKRLGEIADKIKKIDKEKLKDVAELNALVAAHFLKFDFGDNCYPVDSHRDRILKENLFENDSVSLILQGRMGYMCYRQYRAVTNEMMKDALGEDFDYEKRKVTIENKDNGTLDKLFNERNRLDNKLTYLDNLLLHDVVDSPQDVFAYVKAYQQLNDEKKASYDILGYLLKEGYIDEDYFYYISIFQEGRMTPQDHEFLMSVKFDKPKGYGFKLTEVEAIVSNLKNTDYNKPAIVNFYLLQFLLGREKTYDNQCYMFFGALLQTEGVDALYDYIHHYGNVPVFVRRLVRFHVGFVDELFADETHSLQDKLHFVALVFAHAEIDDIRRMNEDHPIREHLNEIDDYWKAFGLCDENKALKVLDTICLKVKCLKEGKSPLLNSLLDHMCEFGMFRLNLENIRFVARKYHLDLDASDSSIYATILNSNLDFLKKHIVNHLNEFVENAANENDANLLSEAEIIGLLKESNVEFETKIDLIVNKEFVVDKEEDIDLDLISYLYDYNRVKPTLSNIMDYYAWSNQQFKENLIEFVNCHIQEFCDEVENAKNIETGYTEFLPAIIKESRLDDKLAYAIIDNPFLLDAWKDHIADLNDNQLFDVLRKKILPSENMNGNMANRFLDYYMRNEAEFDYNLYIKAVELSDDDVLKALASAKFIEKQLLRLKDIPKCLTAMGETFEKFKRVGETIKVPKNGGIQKFVDALHAVKYLGRVTSHGDEISARVLKK